MRNTSIQLNIQSVGTLRTRIWIILGFLSFVFLSGGFFIGERQGLLVGVLLSMTLIGLVIYFSGYHWLEYFRAEPLEGQDPWGIGPLVKELSNRIKIPTPKPYVIQSPFPTMLSIAGGKGGLLVTTGFLESMNYEELRIAVAHEIARLKVGDPLWLGAISGLTAPLFLVATLLDRGVSIVARRHVGTFTALSYPIFALLLRPRYQARFEADHIAAQLVRDPEALARLLLKLQTRSIRAPWTGSPAAAAYMIVNPIAARSSKMPFNSQPSVQKRIERLVGRFPL